MKKPFVLLMIVTSMLLCSCATLELERIPEKFAITKTILCAAQPTGLQAYKANPTNQQKQCEIMYIYFEFENLTVQTDERGEHIWLGLASRLLDVKGNTIQEDPPIQRKFYLRNDGDGKWLSFHFYPMHPQLDLQLGDYSMEFMIADMYAEQGDKAILKFTIISCARSENI